MMTKSYAIIRKMLTILLSELLILSLCGCHQENPTEDATSTSQADGNEDVEGDIAANDPEEQYVESYPRTPIDFTYNSLYEGTLNRKGKPGFWSFRSRSMEGIPWTKNSLPA